MSKVVDYVIGADRNNPDEARAHIYALTAFGQYWPMCSFGWNRSDGTRLSIWRGHTSARGLCKICQRRREQGRRPVIKATPHKTKWI